MRFCQILQKLLCEPSRVHNIRGFFPYAFGPLVLQVELYSFYVFFVTIQKFDMYVLYSFIITQHHCIALNYEQVYFYFVHFS